MKKNKFIKEVARALNDGKKPIVKVPGFMGVSKDIAARAASGESDIFPLPFCISSEAPDDYGTVFKVNGWNVTEFNRNPLVSWGHPDIHSTIDPDYIIGLGPARIEGNKLYADYTPEPGETNVISQKVTNKLIHGIIKKCSIYARIIDGRYGDESKGEDPSIYYFTQMQLLLWGIVPIGSNPEAEIIEEERGEEYNEEEDEGREAEEMEETDEEEREAEEEDDDEARTAQLMIVQKTQVKSTALLAQRLGK